MEFSLLPARANGEAWQSQSAEQVRVTLNSAAGGLSAEEAAKRLAAQGSNELKQGKHISRFQILLGQFKSLIIWILIAAGVIFGVLGEVVDTITILALEAGDLVAADARLLKAASLKCIESTLTREAEAVMKQPATLEHGNIPLGDRENMLFMGTSIAADTGRAFVVATVMNTEVDRIAGLIEAACAERGTPLLQKLDSFRRTLVWTALGIVALFSGLGLLRCTKLFEFTMTSVSLAVAAVPEGLPVVVTVSLALGVLRMSRRNALMRKLPAVETLGSTTVICTDKTGTLTVGEMTVRALCVSGELYEVTGAGYGPDGEARHAAPLLKLPPKSARRMSVNPHAHSGLLLNDLRLPDFRDYAVKVRTPGGALDEATRVQWKFIRDVIKRNPPVSASSDPTRQTRIAGRSVRGEPSLLNSRKSPGQ